MYAIQYTFARSILAVVILVSFQSAEAAAQSCDFDAWQNYKDTALRRHPDKDAYLFITDHMAIDADGAPNAYHPDNLGLDHNANAGFPKESWWPSILVPDPNDPSRPFEQPSGPFAGFFVSKTALADSSLKVTDPARYVDATKVPYLVFPGAFGRLSGTGRLGDFGLAVHLQSGKHTAFIVADSGPSEAALGEVSIALAEALGGTDVSPRTGSGRPPGEVAYVVFRFSSAAAARDRWRLPDGEITRRGAKLLESVGGIAALRACLN
jgi:hypothetical protein